MSIVRTMEFPATTDQYDRVNDEMGVDEAPVEGQIVHIAIDLGGGQMRVVDVWESEEAADAFFETRLGPAIEKVMGAMPEEGQGPAPEIKPAHNVVTS